MPSDVTTFTALTMVIEVCSDFKSKSMGAMFNVKQLFGNDERDSISESL